MSNGTSTGASVTAGGGIGGAISVVIVWVSKQFFEYDMPPDVASAMAVILIAIGGWIGKKIG